jgi:hydroxypyruvate isomerase
MNRRELMAAGLAGTALAGCASPVTETPITPEQYQKAFEGFAVNVESWWTDVPFEQRFDLAAKNHFSHVEFWFIDSWKRKASELAKYAGDAGVKVAQIVGDAPALASSGVRGDFLDNVKRAIENAQILDTDIVTLTGHQDVDGISAEDAL